MIDAYGGAVDFYSHYYINSPFPLAIIRKTKDGRWINANYYDDENLFKMVKKFYGHIYEKAYQHGGAGHLRSIYLGGKKNGNFIERLNREEKLFDRITVLDHPRYIQQYKSKEKQLYIDKYLQVLR